MPHDALPKPFIEIDLPLAVFPEQFFDPPADPPKLALFRAVLDDAVLLLHRTVRRLDDRRDRALFLETLVWLLTDDDPWPCSFSSLCSLLNLNSQWIREGTLRSLAAILAAATPPPVARRAYVSPQRVKPRSSERQPARARGRTRRAPTNAQEAWR
jgi:hypothetical protein